MKEHVMFSGLFCAFLSAASAVFAAGTIDFESIEEFTLNAEDYQLAGNNGGMFTSGKGLLFGYHYVDPPYEWWGGYGVSNRTVVAPDDQWHEYTCAAGGDHTLGAGGAYGIGYSDWESGLGSLINFTETVDLEGAWFSNVVWTTEYMADNYDSDDYYHLNVTAYDNALETLGTTTVDLTNVSDWQWFDLDYENVYALGITMSSSDDFTPYYFCIDDIVVPEPATICLFFGGGWLLFSRNKRQ